MRAGALVLLAAAAVGAFVVSACTSSSAPAKPPPSGPATSAAPTSSSAAPTSSTSTASAAPLSAYEADPAVQGMRQFFAQAGRTINTGHVIDSKLRALVTPYVANQMKRITGPDIGTYYPGPVPFQPLGVSVVNSGDKMITGCLQENGWAQNPKTHKPAHARKIVGTKVNMLLISGRWVVNGLPADSSVSCRNVTVRTQTW